METVNIISAILIYFILPVVVMFGVMILIRRKRQKNAGRYSSMKNQPLNKNAIRDLKEEESYDARHTKPSPENIDPETGEKPGSKEV